MVDVADRCVAVGISAAPIPQLDQLLEESVEVAVRRITTDDRPTHWGGVQAAPPQPPLAGGQDVAGQIGGQRPVALQLGRRSVAGIERGIDGHHDLELGIHVGCGGLAGESFHQGVGHDLVPAPRITGGFHTIGVVAQRLQQATPCSAGRYPDRKLMVSGAGRRLTRRCFRSVRPR